MFPKSCKFLSLSSANFKKGLVFVDWTYPRRRSCRQFSKKHYIFFHIFFCLLNFILVWVSAFRNFFWKFMLVDKNFEHRGAWRSKDPPTQNTKLVSLEISREKEAQSRKNSFWKSSLNLQPPSSFRNFPTFFQDIILPEWQKFHKELFKQRCLRNPFSFSILNNL